MARTRGAKSSSPSSRKKVPRGETVPDPTSEPPRPKAVSPPMKPAPVESSEPIDLTEQSPEPSPVPSPVPSPTPPAEPEEPQPPLPEPQNPFEIAPEAVIRRPMLTQPPIEGNLDCRARPFHSELCFDIATFQLRPELAQSFHLLRRYHMERLLTPRDVFYPRVAMDFYQSMTTNQVRHPTLIHFTIDGRHSILGARHIAEALQIPYEPTHFEDFRVWTSPTKLEMVHILSRGASTRPHLLRGELPPIMFLIDAFLRHNLYPLQHWTQRRGVILEALFKISEGYFFGPHHLIMAALLYFEEKVHKKKLQRADAIPLLFPRLLCQILEHLGYPSEPQLERKRICREVFTLDKWNNMTAYRVEQPERPQPAARRAFPRHIPEGIPIAAPAIPRAPPITPASSEPSTSAEPRMAIPISEYREFMSCIADPHSISDQPCSGDGIHSSMPRADVGRPGSAHYHLKAALASFRPAFSC
ncbi:hypothetical protein CK203_094299 [Vitis vinifera]|uniref:Uncharacterized protein n=1 Tax=Vitis vinifera TaxID=29760 RepID=A0A438DZC2_VITVI|nr:hypothetical protein CK203_094299 [Vitis vinifera]